MFVSAREKQPDRRWRWGNSDIFEYGSMTVYMPRFNSFRNEAKGNRTADIRVTDRTPAEALWAYAVQYPRDHIAVADLSAGIQQDEPQAEEPDYELTEEDIEACMRGEPLPFFEKLARNRTAGEKDWQEEELPPLLADTYICRSNYDDGCCNALRILPFSVEDYLNPLASRLPRGWQSELAKEQKLDIIERVILNLGNGREAFTRASAADFSALSYDKKFRYYRACSQHLYQVAAERKADILIIGGIHPETLAYPEDMARVYAETLAWYLPYFRTIEFALGPSASDFEEDAGWAFREMVADAGEHVSTADREDLVACFADTAGRCQQDEDLRHAIAKSIAKTKLYQLGAEALKPLDQLEKLPGKAAVHVTRYRTLEAAYQLHKQKGRHSIAVLNLVPSISSGDGSKCGSQTQDKCLYLATTLYPVLNTEKKWQEYSRDPCACIYTPGIVAFKTDDDVPQVLADKEDWMQLDVITCVSSCDGDSVAENTGKYLSGELLKLHERCARQILTVAANHEVDVLILGTSGYGASCTNPEIVAQAYANVLPDFLDYFKQIEFAIYDTPQDMRNYRAFCSRLGKIKS